jgi:hypothetical protein
MRDVKNRVIDRHLLLHSDSALSAAARQWHVTNSVNIVEDTRGTCFVTTNSGEFAWAFGKEDRGFLSVPDELL